MEIGILVAAFAFWSIVNLRGVTLGVRLNSIATVAKLLPLLWSPSAARSSSTPTTFAWPTMPPRQRRGTHVAAADFRVCRHRVALVPSGEVRDTARTVPRAIALAMVGITLLYVALQMVAQGILGSGLARATVSPLADAAGASLGGWARSLLLIGATVSMFGYLGGMTLSMPRMLFALARDGFLPRALADGPSRSTARLRPPSSCNRLSRSDLRVSGTFEKLAILANVSALGALPRVRARRRGGSGGWASKARARRFASAGPSPWRWARGAVPWLACGVIVWLLTGLTSGEWLGFAVCLAAASLVYAGTRSRASWPVLRCGVRCRVVGSRYQVSGIRVQDDADGISASGTICAICVHLRLNHLRYLRHLRLICVICGLHAVWHDERRARRGLTRAARSCNTDRALTASTPTDRTLPRRTPPTSRRASRDAFADQQQVAPT